MLTDLNPSRLTTSVSRHEDDASPCNEGEHGMLISVVPLIQRYRVSMLHRTELSSQISDSDDVRLLSGQTRPPSPHLPSEPRHRTSSY